MAAAAATPTPKPTPCPGARWVVAGEPLVPGASTSPDVLVLGTTAAVESGCPPVEIKPRATRRGTQVRAKWLACSGILGTARVTGSIDTQCTLLSAKFVASKMKLKRSFTATVSSCGDGFVDAGAGEQCDGATGCDPGSVCTAGCTCEPVTPNQPPVAVVATPSPADVFDTVSFDGSGSSDPDGDALVPAWDFGDGTRGTGLLAAHAYVASGIYTVRLTVGDGRGGVDTAETSVTIGAGPAAGPTVPATGRVRTIGGAALEGVTISLLGAATSAVTDGSGSATIAVPTLVPVRLQLSRSGFADQVVPLTVPTGAASAYFEAALQPRESAQFFDPGAGGSLDGKDGARVTIPPGGLVDGSGGQFTGTAWVAMTPVDPTLHPGAFPGEYRGFSPGQGPGLLLSYGTVEFVITDGSGNRLNLAPGTAATVELPIYANVHPDGSPILVGDVVPLWTLDERTGTWIQEGTGIVVGAASSPTGLALRGTVSHFSWFNCDFWTPSWYKPKPRCLVDTNADGILEDLTGTAHCWNAGTGPEQPDDGFARAAGPAATGVVFPAFAVQTMIPATGGVVLPIPANTGVRWRATAQDGLLASTKVLRNGQLIPDGIVSGPTDVEEEIVIVLEPVTTGAATPITLPHDATYTLLAGEPRQFSFTAAAGAPIGVAAQRQGGTGQDIGTVIVLGPGGVTFGPWNLGPSIAGGNFTAPSAGEYRVIVNGTGGSFRLLVDNGSVFPLLVSGTPADGATGVSLDAIPSLDFSRDLDPDYVGGGNFWVTSPVGRLSGTVSVSGSEVSFTPVDPPKLFSGTQITVTARAYPPFRATNGIGLLADAGVSFRTADTALEIAGIGRLGRLPKVVVRPDGSAIAHWQNRPGTDTFRPGESFDAVEAIYVPATGWSTPALVGTRRAPAALAVNASGEVLEVLRREAGLGGGFNDLVARRQVAGSAWAGETFVESLAAPQANASPGVAAVIDAAGTATVAWFEDGTNRLWVNRWPAGGSWGTPVEVSTSASSASGDLPPPSMAVNGSGVVALGWVDDGAALMQRHLPGSGWTASEIVAGGGGTVVDVHVGIDDSGNVIAVVNEDGVIRARRRSASTHTWNSAVDLGTDTNGASGSLRSQRLALAVVPTGVAFVATTDPSGAISARRYAPDGGDGTWEAAVPVATSSSPAVELGADASGNAVVAARNGFLGGVVHRTFSTASGWLPPSGSEVADFFGDAQWTMAMGASGPAIAVSDDETRMLAVRF